MGSKIPPEKRLKPPLRLFEVLSEWQTMSPGLERIEAVLNALENPHQSYPHILVGGTNGKGTVCATVAANAGKRTGLFLSPHVYDIRERITIDGEPLADSLWQEAHGYIVEKAPEASERLSYFEWLLTLAVVMFQWEKVSLAVFEVGVGGAKDATNALDPILSAITNVSLDHQKLLGDTVEEIALEKLGIGRKNKPFIISKSVYGIRGVADFLNLRELTPQVIENKQVFDDNLEVSRAILDALGRNSKVEICRLPGRREYLEIGNGIFLDGAHNVDAWLKLVLWCKKVLSINQCNIVCALTAGRDPMEFLETVQSIAEEVYLFEAGYERELPRDVWPDDMRDVREVPLEDLLRRPVLVCGSLYLLGPFRRWLEAELNL